MATIEINRQLLGIEDLALGDSTVTQTRGGQQVTITKINAGNLPFDGVSTLADKIAVVENAEITTTTNATTATNAATSATASATTASNAATTTTNNLNEFKGSYYGALAADPTLDPLGNPITAGDLYFNSVEGVLKYYTGTAWANAGTNVQGLISDETQTATAGQTLFTGLSYDVGYVKAYRNGYRLVKDTDFTATDGTTLTLVEAADLGDIITVESVGVFNNGQLSTILADISQLQTDVTNNTTNITTNATNITTNTNNITTNTNNITTINNTAAFKDQSNIFTQAQRINNNLGLNTADYGSGTGVLGLLDASVVPTTNPTGGLILYSEGGVLKYRKPDGSVFDSSSAQLQLATTQENFDISTLTAISPSILFNDTRVRDYTIFNDTGTVNVALTPGSTYKINSGLLAANETRNGLIFQLKDKNNVNQATYTVDNDKFLFPSNLYTHNHSYKTYMFRIISTFNRPAVGGNQSTTINVNLKREVDDSLVSSKDITYSNVSANTADIKTREFTTFVGGETDPYVADGMYVEIENDSSSDTNITVASANVRMWAI